MDVKYCFGALALKWIIIYAEGTSFYLHELGTRCDRCNGRFALLKVSGKGKGVQREEERERVENKRGRGSSEVID